MSTKKDTALVMPERKFGLLTTVSMIAGIVIGSGIFFQTPKVIRAVNGNVYLGLAGYLIVAVGIIFGGLTVAQYAQRDENVGGIITYCEMAFGKNMGYLAGWFQAVVYYPALVAVLGWVAANFVLGLFGLPNLLTNGGAYVGDITNQWPILWGLTVAFIVGFYLLNVYGTKIAGKFQSFSLVSKLTALVILSVAGIVLGKPIEVLTTAGNFPGTAGGLLAVLGAVAFAYDGWLVAPTVAHEIKNPKKNLTLALIGAPLLITVVYASYFLALVSFVGPQAILEGADPTSILASTIFGDVGMKVVLAFVVVSICGTLNGLTLAYIRTPYALAVRKEIIGADKLAVIDKKFDTPILSSVIAFIISLVWLFLHFASIDGNIMWGWTFVAGFEVDVFPIIMIYAFYIVMYIGIMTKHYDGQSTSVVKKYVYPILATIGALVVILGVFFKANVGGVFDMKIFTQICIWYVVIPIVLIIVGLLIRPKQKAII
jgi:basic amino acid/polyamine antiporter, APA family